MDVDGSNVVKVADDPAGSEFDGAWSPDGEWVVYRDSTRGINDDDEIFIARADGSERRNLTNEPARTTGVPTGRPTDRRSPSTPTATVAGSRGYLVDPDGSNLRLIDVDALGGVPVVLAGWHADRVHGPRPWSTTSIYVADLDDGRRPSS